MVRTYKKKGEKMKYSEEDVARALIAMEKGVSLRTAASTNNIPATSLYQRYKGRSKSPRKIGRKTALLRTEELAIAHNLASLGDFGMAFDITELRKFVKHYLDSQHRVIASFHDNLPGTDWARGFLERYKEILSSRMCQNISRKLAAVSEADVASYFECLETTLQCVPPSNIVNYDETNLTDDPKGKLQIFRKGVKHAERIMNTTKSSTSIMFAITATGEILQPYVVYKGERIQDSWIRGGPLGVHYNRTSSGWFDSDVFVDWFQKVIVRYFNMLPSNEPKVLLGDNLASHINYEVVELCEKNNIRMTFLPPNSTHFLQPLDVGVFGPLKAAWKKIITEWKEGEGKHLTSFPKWAMPPLLLSLMQAMEEKWVPLAEASFKACGIYPFNPEHVLTKLRKVPETSGENALVSTQLLKYLQEKRETSVRHRAAPRRKRVNVPAGVSVSMQDLEESGPSGHCGTTGTAKRSAQQPGDTSSSDEDATVPPRAKQCLRFEEPITATKDLEVGDYILAKFQPKKQTAIHYVGKVISKKDSMWTVTYYRKTNVPNDRDSATVLAFTEPFRKDVFETSDDAIVMKLRLKEAYKKVLLFENIFEDRIIR